MATDGSEEWVDELDIESLISDIKNLDTSAKVESKDCSLNWEISKADQLYEDITEGSFHGFLTSSPKKRRKTRSAPVSPRSQSPVKVKEIIQSFEILINPKSGAIRKTRAATEKGIASPPKPPGEFLRKRKSKKEQDLAKPVKKLLTKQDLIERAKAATKGKARRKPKARALRTMAQPEIPRAGRLNPRARRAGGVGDNKINLGYLELATEGISPQGKIRVATLKQLIEEIVADANLLMMEGCNIRSVEILLTDYIKEIEDNLEKFEKVENDIDGENVNGVLIYNEIIKLNTECKSLLRYCKTQIAAEPPAVAAAAAGQID